MRTNSTQRKPGGNPPGAIVLGGNFVGLGVARSLGKRGIPTWVVDTDKSKSIAQFSRYTKRFIVSQEPVAELLLREAREHNLDGWVVFPGNDQYVESVAASYDALKSIAAANGEELERGYQQMRRYIPVDEILVQERIPGDGKSQFSFCALCKNGRVYASLVARRRRQYPIEFGNASTFVETTSQPTVEAAGRQFLESIGFDGMAEVEFKFDTRDGKYKILDVNPRPWGWHALGKAAGIDFPYLLWRQKVSLETSPVQRARKAAWIREITDLVAILKSRSRSADILGVLKAAVTGKLTSATFDPFDPVPFFAEFALW